MELSGALTVKEVAAFLRVTPQAVYNMVRREEIPAFKVGSAVRVLGADLEAYVGKRKRAFAAQIASYEAPGDWVVAARNLCARFGGRSGGSTAADPSFSLDSVGFELPAGSTLGVVGPSGSGKTLLLKALAGLVPLDAGALFLGPRRVDGLDARSRRAALVFQDYALYPTMDGGRNIAFPLTATGAPKASVGPAVARIAAELGIDPAYLSKRIGELPEGIKQLVAIGRAENRPLDRPLDLLLMDEPLIHLDARRKDEMRVFLKRLVEALGATTVYALNDPADALSLSDFLLVLKEGRSVQFGPAPEVYRRPADAEAMELLSLNGVSFLPGFYAAGSVLLDGLGCEIPAALPAGADPAYRGKATLAFRPEEVEPAVGDGKAGFIRAVLERGAPYDGERVLATGFPAAPGASAAADGVPRVRFLAPADAAGVVAFRPTGAMAYPLG
jgi:multiple sugar transport system ATP-binding protein